ncbi:MAG: prolyl oligopeptidase family serine peptidase [Arenimonas sp.]|uniref:dipeptidyl-peptidase 5 n=1 Tax=Arenimonas sp. TaxID=1872635 RepID=UPI003BFE39D1
MFLRGLSMKARLLLLALLAPLSASAETTAKAPFTIRDLVAYERVSSPTLSPNGRLAVFAVRQTDLAANRGKTGLWIEDLFARDAAPPVRFTAEGLNVNSPGFSPDGQTVYFLSAKSGSMQLWSQAVGSQSAVQVSDLPLDIGSYKLSPDGKHVAFSLEVFPDCADIACTKQRLEAKAANKASGMLFDKLFIRHWDTYADGRRNQLFIAPLQNGKLGTAVRAANVDGDIPSKPFGDAGEYAWAPDGQSLVFSVRIAGKTEAWSTNFDLYHVPVDGKAKPRNLTEANKAWDTSPVFSPDGKTLYYRAMKRPGFEADRFAIMAMDLATGKTREVAPRLDNSAESLAISDDGKTLFTTTQDTGEMPLFAIDIANGEAALVAREGSVREFAVAGNQVLFTRDRLDSPAQLFLSDASGRSARQISVNNREAMDKTAWGAFEQFSFIGWNDQTVHGYVVKPANYVEGRKYPVAFLIHGGPQGSFGNGWSYRWNPQTYAGQGFAVIMIDFHGSTGYGQAFTDAISGHWGDRPLEDLQKGYAHALKKYRFLDSNRACALGASYGGYMVNWIAGNWPEPWKCLVNHDGVFDTRMMGYATEELWFTEWENGGTPFDVPQNYEKFNPVNHVAKWRVPMLVVQGELDYRIPPEQGIATFTALQRKGIESQLLLFPDENHWVLKPQNSILWHDTVNSWLKRWTSGDKPQ